MTQIFDSSLIKNKKKYLKRFNNFLKIADIIKLSDEDFFYLNSKKKPNEVIPNWIKKIISSLLYLQKEREDQYYILRI